MVEPPDSQSLFETQQTVLQSPPNLVNQPRRFNKGLVIAVAAYVVLLVGIAVLGAGKPRPEQQAAIEPTATPTAIPVAKVTEKEAELRRVEAIVNQADPERLLIMPPQVDMEVWMTPNDR